MTLCSRPPLCHSQRRAGKPTGCQKTERLCRDFALQHALHRAQAGILRTGQGDAPRRAGGLQRRQKPRPAGRDLPAQAAERRAVGVEHRGQRFGQQRAEFLPDRLRAGVPGIGSVTAYPDGRFVCGFGAGRGYDFDEFFADAQAAGLGLDLRLGTWDVKPSSEDFLVAVLSLVRFAYSEVVARGMLSRRAPLRRVFANVLPGAFLGTAAVILPFTVCALLLAQPPDPLLFAGLGIDAATAVIAAAAGCLWATRTARRA